MTENLPKSFLIPNGEWTRDFENTLKKVGLELRRTSDRNYAIQIVGQGLDIPANLTRPRDVPRLVDRKTSRKLKMEPTLKMYGEAAIGGTGNDILITTKRRDLEQLRQDWVVPLITDNPRRDRSTVYFAKTPNAVREFGDSPTLAQILEGVHRDIVS